MRKVTTILCSVAFMISGIMMAITATDPSPGTGYKTAAAATVPQPYIPMIPALQRDTGSLDIPDDLVRKLESRGIHAYVVQDGKKIEKHSA